MQEALKSEGEANEQKIIEEAKRIIQDPASQRLTWYKPPLTVLVIKKVRDASVYLPFVQLVHWLIQEKRMVVFVESSVMEDTNLDQYKSFTNIKDSLMTFRDGKDDLTDKIDFIICLGGDGTLLYASQLFQQSVPPVMAFHLGSLGFLTPFQFDNFQEQVNNVLEGHAALTLRSRLRCIVMKKNDQTNSSGEKMKTPDVPTNVLVLNEVVIDRGPSPYLSNIDLFLDGKHITSVQGDGLIVSTPTGSTAYAVAAGASMIHPSVPAIMVTPICPHSLSFRPIVVPAGVELKISVSPDSRNTSWVSFDGRNRQELVHGDSLRVTTSVYPVPSICAQDQISDWFDSLAECLHWNVRKRQKHLDELTDLTHSSSYDTLDSLDRDLLEKGGKIIMTTCFYFLKLLCVTDNSFEDCFIWLFTFSQSYESLAQGVTVVGKKLLFHENGKSIGNMLTFLCTY
ncbi:hypothetical protein JTB14_007426 [Gonioctena quinquepunctata]|nr:hypothetical protein JTB14_007426 [Gonioctena quinquepunctata]